MSGRLVNGITEFLRAAETPTLFCGAGVSAQAGLPAWSQYMREIGELIRPLDPLTRYQMDEQLREGNLTAAASYYFLSTKVPDETKYQNLATPLSNYKPEKIYPLLQLPFRVIATTNFDQSLHDAYAAVHGKAAIDVHPGDRSLRSAQFQANPLIARLHGRIEVPDSIVLSSEQLDKIREDDAYSDFLIYLITRSQILFVGFSFLDPAIRNVLQTVRERFGVYHQGRHLALLPEEADDDFVRELNRYSVRVERYPTADSHAALWEALRQAAEQLGSNGDGTPELVAQPSPFETAKHYLATTYARLQLQNAVAPLSIAVVEGMVSAFVKESGGEGIGFSDLTDRISDTLSLDRQRGEELVENAIRALIKDEICKTHPEDPTRLIGLEGTGDQFEEAIENLVTSVIDRYVVREQGVDDPQIRLCLDAFFRELISRRGWDLGAAFAAKETPKDVDIEPVMWATKEFTDYGHTEKIPGLSRATANVLMQPSPEDSRYLAELGQVSFAVEMVLQSPRSVLLHELTLPEKIYLDANILMPAIVPGHPLHPVYSEALQRLESAAGVSMIDVGAYVYSGFLNEIISHRRAAIRWIEEVAHDDWEKVREEVLLLGSSNVNVFVGAFVNLRETESSLSFEKFLRKYAPYESEKELGDILRKRGFRVAKFDSMVRAGAEYGPLYNVFERFNATSLVRQKKDMRVLEHDIAQVAALNCDTKDGRRALLITADRSLSKSLEGTDYEYVSELILERESFVQFVDLVVGKTTASEGSVRLLWGGSVSGATQRMRDYFIDLALSERREALDWGLGRLVDECAEDAQMALEKEGVSIDSDDVNEQRVAFRTIEGVRDGFYQEIRKRRK